MPNIYMDIRQWMIPGCIELDCEDQWEARYLCIALHVLCFTVEWDITLRKRVAEDEG